MMEVSTGLKTYNVEKEGFHDGVLYKAVARNLRPDHLALLPDQKGAYSIEQGGGLFQTNEEKKAMTKKEMVAKLITNVGWDEDDRETLEGMPETFLVKLIANSGETDGEAKKKAEGVARIKADEEAAKIKAEEDAGGKTRSR